MTETVYIVEMPEGKHPRGCCGVFTEKREFLAAFACQKLAVDWLQSKFDARVLVGQSPQGQIEVLVPAIEPLRFTLQFF